jgi:hypothetical protein
MQLYDDIASGPANFCVLQTLLVEGDGLDLDGQMITGILCIAGGRRSLRINAAPILCSPIYRDMRLAPTEMVEGLMETLADLNIIDERAVVASVPAVRISASLAERIILGFRPVAEDLLRKREVAMLNALWELPAHD